MRTRAMKRSAAETFVASIGDRERMRALLNAGADVNGQAASGVTALQAACFDGNRDVVRLLLDAGADVKVRWEGVTTLMLACRKGHADVVQLLLDAGADASAADYHGLTPLIVASHEGHGDVVRHLLDAGADVETTREGFTALLAACCKGHSKIVRHLIQARAVGAAAKNDAIAAAVSRGHAACVYPLLKLGVRIPESVAVAHHPIANRILRLFDHWQRIFKNLLTLRAIITSWTERTWAPGGSGARSSMKRVREAAGAPAADSSSCGDFDDEPRSLIKSARRHIARTTTGWNAENTLLCMRMDRFILLKEAAVASRCSGSAVKT